MSDSTLAIALVVAVLLAITSIGVRVRGLEAEVYRQTSEYSLQGY